MVAKKKFFHIYSLVDPRTAQPFYIGKGVADRRVQHFKSLPTNDTRKDRVNPKSERIKEILAAGLKPTAIILAHFDDEDEAYAAEVDMIKAIGRENLLNQNDGGAGGVASSKKRSDPAWLPPKQEAFALIMAKCDGTSITDAYRQCYNVAANTTKKTVNEQASRIFHNHKVVARIEELKAPIIAKQGITLEYLIEELQTAAALAKETGNAGAITGAVKEMGKLFSLYPVEKKEVSVSVDDITATIHAGRERARRFKEENDV